MSEMVERVARAICAAMRWPWEDPCRTSSDTQERGRGGGSDPIGKDTK